MQTNHSWKSDYEQAFNVCNAPKRAVVASRSCGWYEILVDGSRGMLPCWRRQEIQSLTLNLRARVHRGTK